MGVSLGALGIEIEPTPAPDLKAIELFRHRLDGKTVLLVGAIIQSLFGFAEAEMLSWKTSRFGQSWAHTVHFGMVPNPSMLIPQLEPATRRFMSEAIAASHVEWGKE